MGLRGGCFEGVVPQVVGLLGGRWLLKTCVLWGNSPISMAWVSHRIVD